MNMKDRIVFLLNKYDDTYNNQNNLCCNFRQSLIDDFYTAII